MTTGWTVRGSNIGGGRDFPYPSRPGVGPTQLVVQWVPALFPELKRPAPGVDLSPTCRLTPRLKKGIAISLLTLWALAGRRAEAFNCQAAYIV